MSKIIIKWIFVIFLFIFIGCQENKNDYKLPKPHETSSIIKAVIFDDSLGVYKDFNQKTKLSFSEDLQKLEIVSWDVKKSKFPPKVSSNSKLIQDFIGFPDVPRKFFFFSKLDSSYLQFQNKNFKKFKLEKKSFGKLNLQSLIQLKKDFKTKEYFSFFYCTIPIVSLDGKRAFVQFTLVCSGLCGEGREIFLEKVNRKWRIVKIHRDWVS